jgi:hypothetical protein
MDVQKQHFKNALHHKKAVLQELESKYNELQRMYENRPSRQESIQKIYELDTQRQPREENYHSQASRIASSYFIAAGGAEDARAYDV